MKKSVEGSCQDQHDCKDDSRTSKKRSAVGSSKFGAARCTNRERQVGPGEQLEKSQQSKPTQGGKLQSVPVMKRKIQKTAGTGLKAPLVYNLRSRDQKTGGAKDLPAYNLRSNVLKTEAQNASTVMQKRRAQKRDGSEDSSVAVQKRGILKTELQRTSCPKSSAPLPIKKTGTTKSLTTFLSGHDRKSQPSPSQYEQHFCDPIYHIRWEGDMENGPLGQKCILCNKDLSGATEDDDSELNEDLEYEDEDEDEDDGEYEYYEDVTPPLLPAVDILACGHAYHTECLQQEEQSNDPQCVLCSRMA